MLTCTVFTFRNQYWLWCPVIGPIVGALVGTFIYDALFFTGSESILNKPCVTSLFSSSYHSVLTHFLDPS